MNRRLALVILAPLLLAAAGDPTGDTVAQRGDLRMTAGEVRDMLSRVDPATRAKLESNATALAAFVRDRLLDQALLAEAHAKGWDQRPDVVARANEARDAVILQSYAASLVPADPAFPSDADVNAAYEANKTRFIIPRQYHLTQIVILVPANATKEAEDDARRKAVDLRAQVLKPKADFGDIAKKQSQEKTTAEKGGDLGWVREDQLLPQLRDPIAALPEGATTDAIRMPDGFHIIRNLGIKPATPAPLADVKPQLVQALQQARAQQIIRTYVEDMLRKEPVQLNEIDLAKQVTGTH
jgi:peptidylprolyl isomerase